jgi:tetratricopeptide (TPR) repeat protein
MNDQQKTPAAATPTTPAQNRVPANLPLEMLPVYDWWKANGSRMLTTAAIVVIAVSSTVIYLRYRSSRAAEAATATATARSLDELESAVDRYGSTPAGTASHLRLAKAYFDAAKYEDALRTYDTFIQKHSSHPFIEVAKLGRAQALEGLSRSAEALEIYRTFRAANRTHYLAPTAWMGEARCLALLGQKAEAKALLDDLRAAHAGTPWEAVAKHLQGVIERYDGRSLAPASLFDQANALPALETAAATNAPAAP